MGSAITASGRVAGEQRAVVHDGHPVGEPEAHVHPVLHQHDGGAQGVTTRGSPRPVRHVLRAHAGGGLVQQQHRRLADDRQRHLELALAAVGQGGRGEVAGAVDAGRRLQRLPCAWTAASLAADAGARASRSRRGGPGGQPHVLQHAEVTGTSWSTGSCGPGRRRARRKGGARGDVPPARSIRAGGRPDESGQQVEQAWSCRRRWGRAPPGTRLGPHVERDVAEDPHAADGHAQRAGRQHVRHR